MVTAASLSSLRKEGQGQEEGKERSVLGSREGPCVCAKLDASHIGVEACVSEIYVFLESHITFSSGKSKETDATCQLFTRHSIEYMDLPLLS